ncbi:hypothetical protein [Oceanibaculum pacificum]|uniref:Uncharacterized protein n=1 Tax=Oceanibaculum pacificum TaxID=580166 RepID=A0A154W7G9_9PROT|nr:hypothetical protein [Oceanibaculum pacificum]KZD09423.1 hypothetical protein AUP43_07330 [Oceanibaculum pacificum]
MRAVKISIVIMSVLIVVGLAVIAVEMAGRMSGRKADPAVAATAIAAVPLSSFEDTKVALPPRTTLRQIIPAGDRAILHLDGPLGQDVLMVLDMATGRVLGSFTLEPTR